MQPYLEIFLSGPPGSIYSIGAYGWFVEMDALKKSPAMLTLPYDLL